MPVNSVVYKFVDWRRARKQELKERAAWDRTLSDGLEND